MSLSDTIMQERLKVDCVTCKAAVPKFLSGLLSMKHHRAWYCVCVCVSGVLLLDGGYFDGAGGGYLAEIICFM